MSTKESVDAIQTIEEIKAWMETDSIIFLSEKDRLEGIDKALNKYYSNVNKEEVSLKLVNSESGDWVMVYVNDILNHEGHYVDWAEIIQEFKYFTGEIKNYEVSQEAMEIGLPNNFNEIEYADFR